MIEVVVIGGGLAGAATALALVERGAAVTVLDAERPGSAATGAAAGMLAPQYESSGPGPLYHALVQARFAYPYFARLIEEFAGASIDLRTDGMLVANLTDTEHDAAAAMVEWQRAEGQHGELLDHAAAARLQPGLADAVHSWLWLPDEGQVDTQRLAELLGDALGAAGVRVLVNRRGAAIETAGGAVRAVRLEDGRELAADAVILAAGAWSGTVHGVPRTVTVRPVRGHILRYAAGAAALRRIVTSHDARYLVPRGDGSIIAGSTMDDSGFDRSIDETGLLAVHESAARLLPALAAVRPAEQWADLRPISADGLPIIGADPELEGLFYATGYGRNGILLAPLAGQLLAARVFGHELPEDWSAFSPARLPAA
jgi:glycine oxidase